jgi:hypothetical protein
MTEHAGGSPNFADADVLSRDDGGVSRRKLLLGTAGGLGLAALGLFTAACTGDHHPVTHLNPVPGESQGVTASANPELDPNVMFVQKAGESLLAMGEPGNGGLRFRSQIQAGPNGEARYQTDTDVGAAGIMRGFIVLAKLFPHDPRWTDAARKTATWLTSVSIDDGKGGRYWPDYVDANGTASDSAYTSFDDGTMGVGNTFWELYELTGDEQYKETAMQAATWTMSKAENIGSSDNNATFRWRWDTANSSPYYMGMGEGVVGLVDTLALFRDRTKTTDPAFSAKCQHYIDGALRYIAKVRKALGNNDGDSRALPETGVIGQDDDTVENSGYLSGAAGAAVMFEYLQRHDTSGSTKYRAEADRLFSWLNSTGSGPKVNFGDGTAAWKLDLDPQDVDNNHYANGVEEGLAGIGWAHLQAYIVTGQEKYLAIARQAADRLLKVAIKGPNGQLSWREYQNPASPLVHANLNNGAAGIGMFLYDMSEALKKKDPVVAARYLAGAQGAQKWLMATAVHKGGLVYWHDYGRGDNNAPYSKDPSWHWGNAGIIAFLARMSGGTVDIPGEQLAL